MKLPNRFLVLLLSTAFVSACNKEPEGAVPDRASESKAELAGKSAAPSGASSVEAGVRNANSSASARTNVDEYLCNPADPRCGIDNDPFSASTKQEAQWLAEHGYPSKSNFERLKTMSLDQLQSEAKSGNRSAAVLYAKKLAMNPSQFSKGVLILQDEAASGNLYAYYGLSELYWKSPEHKSLVDSAAYLRVAYLLGDWKASDQIAKLQLPQAELAAADKRAASLLNTFSGGLEPSRRPLE